MKFKNKQKRTIDKFKCDGNFKSDLKFKFP